MKNTIVMVLILVVMVAFNTPGFAQDWDSEFISDLAKIRSQKKTGGLGYTVSEEEALEKAIQKAMDQEAPSCEVMKLAVDEPYLFNPNTVITSIFNSGAKIDLDELCMCATESGISKSVTAQAASAAADANMLARDEITQSQCLREGLGFTEAAAELPPIDTYQEQDSYSKSDPG